jgi:hypothetical protein
MKHARQQIRNPDKILVGKPVERDHLQDLG